MVTEPVLPVKSVVSEMCVEGMVTGWRGVAEGLAFLHDKVSVLMYVYVYVSTPLSSHSHSRPISLITTWG